MLVIPTELTDAEVRPSLDKIEEAITIKAKDMTVKVNRYNVEKDNPPVRRMRDSLRDFTRMNPPIFTGSMNSEDLQEFVDEFE